MEYAAIDGIQIGLLSRWLYSHAPEQEKKDPKGAVHHICRNSC